jgi:protein SCO1/2
MATVTRRSWLLTLGVAPVAGGLGAWAQGRRPRHAGHTLSARERIQQQHLPNVEVVTHAGRRVRFYDDLVKDKKVIINFMYAKCDGICVPVTMNLARVQKRLGDRVGRDIFMYSITLKPAEDSAEALRQYREDHGVEGDWLFLTGALHDIDHLRRALGFAFADPGEDADTSNHIGMVRYGVEPQVKWAACPGMANPEHIVRSILWDLG